ncbi:hypothetical protein HO446_07490 [Streptococcus suis]|nr:hypothetical protein [Streptococcus suis]
MKVITLPCGCKRKLEDIIVDGVEHEVQIFGHTPDSPPLTDKDKEIIANIIRSSIQKKEQEEKLDVS